MIKNIAKELGCSIPAVSGVLRNSHEISLRRKNIIIAHTKRSIIILTRSQGA